MAEESERQELDEKEDRISDLPDSIIHHILSLLPFTKEAIRTGILSKRWQNQWTQVPVLVFYKDGLHHEEDGDEYDEAFSQSIDNSLRLYRSSKIKKLHLCYNFRGDANFISKIRFANAKYVEELILVFDSFVEEDDPYLLPECIFENASLVTLETYQCDFPLSLRINWPSLKVLKIEFCTDGQVIERVVSSCPSLEYLKLEKYFWEIDIIASKSLKRLTLRDFPIGQLTKILCPNLEKLSINDVRIDYMVPVAILIANVLSGTPLLHSFKLTDCCFDQLVIASKSLKKLVLRSIDASCAIEISCPNIEELKLDSLDTKNYKLMNLTSSTCVTLGSLTPAWFQAKCDENLARRILEQLQQVKELRVNKWFVQVLSIFEFGGLSYPLLNIKCLTLDRLPLEHIWGVVNALRCSPALERLVINEFDDYNGDLNNFEEAYKNSNGIDFPCLMLHLKTVKITRLSERDGECKVLPFVEFLLKNARTLEKMVVTLSGGMMKPQAKVLAKLLSFPRCSPHAILELL